MSDMKCPFCQQELKPQTMDGEWLECWNCSYHEPSHHPFPQRILCGTKELWERLIYFANEVDLAVEAQIERTKELDRTRKASEIAIDALKEQQRWLGIIRISMVSHLNNEKGTEFQPYDADPTVLNTDKAKVLLNNALEQITALEQKD